jgi:hypothetical protein
LQVLNYLRLWEYKGILSLKMMLRKKNSNNYSKKPLKFEEKQKDPDTTKKPTRNYEGIQ